MTDRLPPASLCRSGRHCHACRDRGDRGLRWRAALAALYGLAADWPCPAGRPWGFRPPAHDADRGGAVIRAGIALARRRAASCRACTEPVCSVRQFLDRLPPCARLARLRRPGYACPFDRWPPP